MEWIYLAHCRDQCQGTVNMELNLHAIKFAEFLIRGVTVSLSINTLLYGVSLGNLIRIFAICIQPTLLMRAKSWGTRRTGIAGCCEVSNKYIRNSSIQDVGM
jgi:hypothetical protein